MRTGQLVRGISGVLFLLLLSSSVTAQTIVRIEEDWALHVVEPDMQLDSPQITTAMLPLGPNSKVLFFLDINHGSTPDYSAGGLQLRIEQDGTTSANSRILSGVKLSHASETIRWTQVAIQQGNQVKFGIVDGVSETWDYFGGTHRSSPRLQQTARSPNIASPIH